MFYFSICQLLLTSDSGEAGEGVTGCYLYTDHIGGAGIQSCEIELVAVGRVPAEAAV